MKNFYQAPVEEQIGRLRALALEALKHWAVEGCEPVLLKYRENAVFKVRTPGGQPAALRVHRHGYHSDAELNSELAWMAALKADGIETPAAVPTRDGAAFAMSSAPGVPEPRQVDMMEWLTGEPFGSLEAGLNGALTDVHKAFIRVGQVTARVHNQTETWAPPAGFTRHAWDLEGLLGERPFWGRFWELASLSAAQRTLIDRAREAARGALIAYGRQPRRYGLIHADLTIDNMILGEDSIRILDFDDSGFGWHLFDLATILIFLQGNPNYDAIQRGVIDGYRGVRDLPDQELAHMPLFFLLRSFTYLGWLHTRFETPAATELAPTIVGIACDAAERFLANPRSPS